MKNYFGKNVLIGLIVICLAIIASVFISYTRWSVEPIVNSNLNPFGHQLPSPSSPRQDEWTKTVVYHNEKYKYTLVYPSLYLYVETRVPEEVYFIDSEDTSGRMHIVVKPTTYSTPDDELKAKNEKYDSHDFLEKRIKIAGYDAIVTYPVSKVDKFPDQTESFPNEKTTLFIKDRYLYKIMTSSIDHERIWNSFKFE